MPQIDVRLRDELASVATAGRYRYRRVVESIDPDQPLRVRVDGRVCVNFCSNDYLGLASHPDLRRAMIAAAERYGAGSGASHLVTGHGPAHHALEEALAEFTGRERALLFSTGYMANLGVASALLGRGDRVLEDRLNHASLLDAGLSSGAEFNRYPHGNVSALAEALAKRRVPAQRTLVLTDGVFSMDGDIAPLPELAKVCEAHQAWLMVDDAHGFGVLGPDGRGSVAAAGLGIEDVPIYMATLGKACGMFGAFVAGSESLIEILIQKARTYIYTTALPAAVAAANSAALQLSRAEAWRRARLNEHILRFRRGAAALALQILPSPTAIQPLVLGDEAAALAASEALLKAGFLVAAIRPPTVPAGSSRLRITLSAAHAEEDIDRLLDALSGLARAQALP